MTYRADPLTQRDGSALASSNCRPTSIAVGLDYQELGEKRSSGATMRSFMTDQAGGTDSADAREAWSRGYGEDLIVRDGSTWAQLEADLDAGRLVHVDVWHASVGGPCLSGSGAYGHTMAVAPERSGSRLLVCDPWCSPPKWEWTEIARLKAGAEEWSRRIGVSTAGRRRLVGAELVAAMRAKGRRLMTLYRPGRPMPASFPRGPETGGAPALMFTVTAAPGGAGGDDVQYITSDQADLVSRKLLNVGAGSPWYYLDGSDGGTFGAAATVQWVGKGDANNERHVVEIGTGRPYSDGQSRPTLVLVKSTNKPYDAPPPAEPPSSDEIAAAVAARDDEWSAALIGGEPWPSSGE